jgi:hypothetical protein
VLCGKWQQRTGLVTAGAAEVPPAAMTPSQYIQLRASTIFSEVSDKISFQRAHHMSEAKSVLKSLPVDQAEGSQGTPGKWSTNPKVSPPTRRST